LGLVSELRRDDVLGSSKRLNSATFPSPAAGAAVLTEAQSSHGTICSSARMPSAERLEQRASGERSAGVRSWSERTVLDVEPVDIQGEGDMLEVALSNEVLGESDASVEGLCTASAGAAGCWSKRTR
jgi:hypothetical protein